MTQGGKLPSLEGRGWGRVGERSETFAGAGVSAAYRRTHHRAGANVPRTFAALSGGQGGRIDPLPCREGRKPGLLVVLASQEPRNVERVAAEAGLRLLLDLGLGGAAGDARHALEQGAALARRLRLGLGG